MKKKRVARKASPKTWESLFASCVAALKDDKALAARLKLAKDLKDLEKARHFDRETLDNAFFCGRKRSCFMCRSERPKGKKWIELLRFPEVVCSSSCLNSYCMGYDLT